jgi:peptidoglycan/LPS O-acetylase OafA/YrhL
MKRVAQLDSVRGIAILLVLFWHYFTCQVGGASNAILTRCGHFSSLTWSGVDLFFVLSGFLIAGILLDHRNSSNYFRIFYLRRACRILPLYFLLLASFLGLAWTRLFTSPSFQWLFQDPAPVWSYATFTQNIFMGFRGDFGARWLGITWSLAVEEQFYLVVPLLIYFLPRRLLFCVLIMGIVTAPTLRCISPGFHAFVNTPWRSDSLLSGAALAVLVRWRPFEAVLREYQRFFLVLFGFLLAGAAVMSLRPDRFGQLDHFWLAGLYATFVLIAFASGNPYVGRLLKLAPLVWLGQVSYGVYMFHQAASGLLHGAIHQSAPRLHTWSDAAITIAALGVTLAVSAISYYFFEKPILRFAHRFQYSPRAVHRERNVEESSGVPS